MKKAFLCILTGLISFNPALGAVVAHAPINFEETRNGITVRITTISPDDAADMFDGRGKYLTDITPVKIMVNNTSDRSIGFSSKHFGIRLLNSQAVMERIGYSVIARSSGIGLAFIFCGVGLFTLVTGLIGGYSNSAIFTAASIGMFFGAGVFMVTSPIVGVVSSGITYNNANKTLRESIEENQFQELSQNSMIRPNQVKESMHIEPGESTELLVFVRTKSLKPFDIRFNQIGTQAKHIVHVQ